MLRAAAVGGGAYMAGKRRAEGQMQAQQEQQAPAPAAAPEPAPSAGISADAMQKLQDLGKLHEQGILTDDEFSTQKARLLAS